MSVLIIPANPKGGEIKDTKTLNLLCNMSTFIAWQVVRLMKMSNKAKIYKGVSFYRKCGAALVESIYW